MWIPYGLSGQLKSESAADTIKAAQEDSRPRDYLVGFYLSNPVSQAWESDVVPDAEVRATGERVAIDGGTALLQVAMNAGGKLQELIFELKASAPHAAIEACLATANRRLDEWALYSGRGMDVAGWRVADIEHHARWRCVPFRPSVVEVAAPERTWVPTSHAALVRLYRQARNASAPEWRLLCAVAILEAWENRHEPFASTERWLRTGTERRRIPSVSFDMLLRSGALARFRSFEGDAIDEVLARLVPLRNEILATVGGLPLQYALIGEDAGTDRTVLTALANLADLLAREVLLDELELARKMGEAVARSERAEV